MQVNEMPDKILVTSMGGEELEEPIVATVVALVKYYEM